MCNKFKCNDCGEFKPVNTEGGTGYAVLPNGANVCYACCAIRDREDMVKTGRATLYLEYRDYGVRGWLGTRYESATVGNWPGTLKFHTQAVKVGRHNMAGRRYDVWFKGPDGKEWHGVTYGDNTQLCHCRRVKG